MQWLVINDGLLLLLVPWLLASGWRARATINNACCTAHRRRATREAAHCSIATRNHA
jgi:hypothetical protein